MPSEEGNVVLIIDDNRHIRDLFFEFLSINNYLVMSAPSGEKGIEMINTHQIDLVLLDIKLPGMGGMEVLEKIKMHDPGIRVIMLTGMGYDLDVTKQAIELGASAYVNKKMSLDETLLTIEDVLRKAPPKPIKSKIQDTDAKSESSLSTPTNDDNEDCTQILVVDDEKESCLMISEYLSILGYHSISAHTAEEGIEKLKENRVDCVLLDIKMPGMGGVAGLKEMKKIRPDLSVIIVTAVIDEDTLREVTASGAASYLLKPFAFEQLKANLLMVLTKKA